MAVLEHVQLALRSKASSERAKSSAWFFKTGPGQYGEGDQFLGVTVPQQHKISKQFYKNLSLEAMEQMLKSPWHEERLTGLFMLVLAYQKGDDFKKAQVANLYLANTKRVNNWDLVDSSASYILGPWLEVSQYKMKTLSKLARSDNLWERRIAMLTTLYYIGKGDADEALQIIEKLKHDKHDLIQKAVGWMLREIGKRVSQEILIKFLDENATTLPRTTLRYAIERLPEQTRKFYLKKVKITSLNQSKL
ncbi:MAG: DNA alkylation repair protein [Patescibacteria group bacterium]|mgnify:CR=1 FL=1